MTKDYLLTQVELLWKKKRYQAQRILTVICIDLIFLRVACGLPLIKNIKNIGSSIQCNKLDSQGKRL